MPLTPGPQVLDLGNPVSDHPDNAGLSLLLLGLPEIPGVGGGSKLWPDLTGKAAAGPRYTTGGTLTNGPTWAATPYGQLGVSFDGVDDSVEGPGVTVSGNPWTVAVWVRPASTSTGQYLADHQDTVNAANVRALICGFQAGCYNVFNQGYPTGNAADTQITASGAGLWDRLVYTTDGARVRGYLNGAKKVDVAANLNPGGGKTIALALGHPRGTAGDYFGGVLAGYLERNVAADDAWAARDYAWSQNPRTDPRLRWYTPRAWAFGGAAAGGGGTDTPIPTDPGTVTTAGGAVVFNLGFAVGGAVVTCGGGSVILDAGLAAAGANVAAGGGVAGFDLGLSAGAGTATVAGSPAAFDLGLSAGRGAVALAGVDAVFNLTGSVTLAAGPGTVTAGGGAVVFGLGVAAGASPVAVAGPDTSFGLGVAAGPGTVTVYGGAAVPTVTGRGVTILVSAGPFAITDRGKTLTITDRTATFTVTD